MIDLVETYGYLASQTALKDFEKEATCPVRWKHQWLLKEFDREPSIYMDYGQVFESIAIGGMADGEAKDIEELPKNKNGTMKAEVVRLREQAEYCHSILFDKEHEDYLGIEVTAVQKVVSLEDKRIVLDFVGKNEEGLVIGDIKLSGDVHGTFGDFSWGATYQMDFIQQGLYQMILEDVYGVPVNTNLLLVFDYKPTKGKKVLEVFLTDSGRVNIKDRFDTFYDVVNHYEENGWPYVPSIKECGKCLLACKKRFTEFKLEKEEIYI